MHKKSPGDRSETSSTSSPKVIINMLNQVTEFVVCLVRDHHGICLQRLVIC